MSSHRQREQQRTGRLSISPLTMATDGSRSRSSSAVGDGGNSPVPPPPQVAAAAAAANNTGKINRFRLINIFMSEQFRFRLSQIKQGLSKDEMDRGNKSMDPSFYPDILAAYLNNVGNDIPEYDKLHFLEDRLKDDDVWGDEDPCCVDVPSQKVGVEAIEAAMKDLFAKYDTAISNKNQSGQHETIPVSNFTKPMGLAVTYLHYHLKPYKDLIEAITRRLPDDVRIAP